MMKEGGGVGGIMREKMCTHIPMSQRMSEVLSDERMLANTSHECNTVSPIHKYKTIIYTSA
jgi:hypothetical protein